MIGIPGCGKTMSAKALSAEWQWPLVKLDLGAMRSKFVGESEARLRGLYADLLPLLAPDAGGCPANV